jgi:hypothetical protein
MHYRIEQELATAPRTIAHSKSDRSIICKSIFSIFLIYRTKKLGGSKRPGVNYPDFNYAPITPVPDIFVVPQLPIIIFPLHLFCPYIFLG